MNGEEEIDEYNIVDLINGQELDDAQSTKIKGDSQEEANEGHIFPHESVEVRFH